MTFLALIGWILIVLLGIALGLVIYARWNYGTLEALAIPVVKPFLFLGSNYNEAYVDVQDLDIARQKQYGDIYGVYDGRRPQIYISDPKLIRQITVANFDNFKNHDWDFPAHMGFFENFLDLLKDEQWRTVRSALTPIFTSRKLKQLNTVVQEIGENYAKTLLEKCTSSGGRLEGIRIKDFAAPMIIEILAKCFCGISIPNTKDDNNDFIAKMKVAILHEFPQDDWKIQFIKIFPIMAHIIRPNYDPEALDVLVAAIKNVLDARGKSGEVSIDATATLVEMMKKVRTDPIYKRLKITEEMVISQGWELFVAGYMGIRDGFGFLMYQLAAYPEIQEEVYAEIKELQDKNDGNVPLEAIVNNLPLLSACLIETTRLHSAFFRPGRVCNQDWSYEGIRIPKGMQIVFPHAALHYDSGRYPNPETFDPRRWLEEAKKERDPYAYFGFGQGPRNCIGQRFALEMLKILMVSFLSNFKTKKRVDTICERYPGGSLILSFKPLVLDIVKR